MYYGDILFRMSRLGIWHIETYLGQKIWKFIGLDEYLRYGSSLEAYPWISNVTSDDDLGLNLCIVPTTCYTVIISESQGFSKKRFLVEVLVSLG